MRFVEPNRFTDPDAAARKLVEIANAIEHAQDGRIHIELVNGAFLKAGGTPDQYRAGIERAIRSAFPSALGLLATRAEVAHCRTTDVGGKAENVRSQRGFRAL